jgi:calcineurin-like phosphoesterase
MKIFTFHDPDIQEKWLVFEPAVKEILNGINAEVPKDVNHRTKGIESIIETLMDKQFPITRLMGRIEYFVNVANAQAVMDIYEKNPKCSTTIIKAQAEGEISELIALQAYAKYLWQAMERALISAQALMKRLP